MVTMKDIAREAGVSQPTVSAVLRNKEYCYVSEAKKELIKKVAKEMGYVPNQSARNLRGMKSKTIGIIGSIYRVPIHSLFLNYLSEEIWQRGYHVMLGDSKGEIVREKEIINDFIARGVDAFIISGAEYDREEAFGKINYVLLKPGLPEADAGIDLEAGTYEVTQHLIKTHNHQKIALFSSELSSNVSKEIGFKKAITEAALECSEKQFIENSLDPKSGNKILHLIKNDHVTAFVATNDELAYRLIRFLEGNGYNIPNDIAVTGFDGLPMSEFGTPALTTVKQPVDKLAKKTVDYIMNIMAGKKKNKEKILVKTELIIRSSCGCKNNIDYNKILQLTEKA